MLIPMSLLDWYKPLGKGNKPMVTRTTHRYFMGMLLLAVGAMLLSSILYVFRHQETDTNRQISQFQQMFEQKDLQAQGALQHFIGQIGQMKETTDEEHKLVQQLNDQYKKKGLSFFFFSGDSLRLWTNSTVPLDDFDDQGDSFGVSRLKNGWYFFRQHQEGEHRYLAFSLIKHGYRYQNAFLVNLFHPDYAIPDDLYFLTDRVEEGYPIYNADNEFAFSLNLRRTTGLYETRLPVVVLSALLAIGGLLMFVFYAFRYFSRLFQQQNKTMAIAGFVLVITALRMATFFWSFPHVFYHGNLFSPALYATSRWLPSLGDLFLHVLFFSIMAFFLFTHLKQFAGKGSINQAGRILLSIGIMGLIYLFCNLAVFLIRSLVIDSHLNLDVNFIWSLDVFSLVGFLIIGCIFFSFFFLSVVLFRLALNLLQHQSRLWMVFILSLVVIVSWHWVIEGPGPLHWLLFIAAILVFEMERKSDSPQAGFTSLLVSIFLFSLISSFALYNFNREKDLEKRKTLALQLASEQDPVAEFMFLEMEEALFSDNQLRNLIRNDPYNESAIYRYLQHHYFYDFWARYDLQVTVCHHDEMLIVKPTNLLISCEEYFGDYIEAFGRPTISDNLVYLDNNTGRNSYIAIIPIKMHDQEELLDDAMVVTYNVYLELDAKYVARDLGFPELLIDERIDVNRDLVNYSYATYKDGVLMSKSGIYNYSVYASAYDRFEGTFASFVFDGYHHLLYRRDQDTHIIISRPVETFLEGIAPFSYLFILFFALVVIFYMLTSKRPMSDLFRLNFKRRVQVSMITIVVVSVVAIGGASILFFKNVSTNKNLSFLSEKAHSILIETEMALDMQEIWQFDEQTISFISDQLLRLSNIYFTDINLYDIDGQLLASSRPRVFEEGLAGSLMNPNAYFMLRNHRLNQFIHTENIGKLEYLSAYVLLRNHYHELIGYINLPYFAKQGELRNEMSFFLVAFINIYLLLLVIAILVALFISNFVTQPLHLIRENLSKLQLGRKNTKIQWMRRDEIGDLINEYNRMVDELEESAELLARSERETAWREMAKQVAHEIKNPLTPMRLNIQYLEKAWREKVPDWDDHLARFSKTMVEQIDNLALIAGAFSDFAQMPEGQNDKLDFRSFMPEVLNLYNDTEHVSIHLSMPIDEWPLVARADRNQLMRVMNNLISNAIQAYPKHQKAQVEVNCRREPEAIYVEVKDKGCGIPESLQNNVFSPNFTTKTSGMGLGLSIVKTIIENMGGRVGFFSEEGQGSIFYFRLPLADRHDGLFL